MPSPARERQLPQVALPLTQRNAQLVIARGSSFAGWQDLTAEVSKRLGHGLEWAATQARRVIHDNDVERLKQLLAEYPALLSWQGADRSPLTWPEMAACWEWPQAPMATPATRSENSSSPVRHAQSC